MTCELDTSAQKRYRITKCVRSVLIGCHEHASPLQDSSIIEEKTFFPDRPQLQEDLEELLQDVELEDGDTPYVPVVGDVKTLADWEGCGAKVASYRGSLSGGQGMKVCVKCLIENN